MYPHDYHLHSNFSCDGKASIVEQCLSAIAKGLPEIGITDHFDLYPGDECRGFFRPIEWAPSSTGRADQFASFPIRCRLPRQIAEQNRGESREELKSGDALDDIAAKTLPAIPCSPSTSAG